MLVSGSRAIVGLLLAVAVSSALLAPAAEASTRDGVFKTPSGNIVCQWWVDFPLLGEQTTTAIFCGIHSGLKPPPARRPCTDGGYAPYFVKMYAFGRPNVPRCMGDPGPFVVEQRARVLGYGRSWTGPGMRCSSEMRGLTCRNRQGHGFFLSRERWRAF